jgi:hypothetical protein
MLAFPVGGATKGSSPCHAATLSRHRPVTPPHHHGATLSAHFPNHIVTPPRRTLPHCHIVPLSHRWLVALLQHFTEDCRAVARRNGRLSSHFRSTFDGQTLLLHRDDDVASATLQRNEQDRSHLHSIFRLLHLPLL